MMEAAKAMRLLQEQQVQRIRDAAARGDFGSNATPYGSEMTIGTGRATCRACGEKIERDVSCIKFAWDYQGSGSWTAIVSFLHAHDCAPGSKE